MSIKPRFTLSALLLVMSLLAYSGHKSVIHAQSNGNFTIMPLGSNLTNVRLGDNFTNMPLGDNLTNMRLGGNLKIMPLGDSITDGSNVPGGYRVDLWQKLAAYGHTDAFVGSQSNGPATLGDHDHEGHPGWRIDQIDAHIVGWLTTYQPRTILLHIGTNDMIQNYDVANAPTRLGTLLDDITVTDPTADVFVATITPLADQTINVRATTYNNALPGIVSSRIIAGKHIHLVDMQDALTTADLADGVHPTAGGYAKMANRWYSALIGSPVTHWEAENVTISDARRIVDATASGSLKTGYIDYAVQAHFQPERQCHAGLCTLAVAHQ